MGDTGFRELARSGLLLGHWPKGGRPGMEAGADREDDPYRLTVSPTSSNPNAFPFSTAGTPFTIQTGSGASMR